MLKMTIDNEEVVSDKDITINEEMLSASSTILNNVYPKDWEEDKDYTSRFYYPQDYSKALIQRSYVTQEAEAGTTIQVNGSATLTDVDTNKNSRVLRLLGQTSQTGTPTPSSPIPVNVVSGDNEIFINGKNILDVSQTIVGKAWNNASNSARAVCYAPATEGLDYTGSFTGSSMDGVYLFFKANKEDSTIIGGTYQVSGSRTVTAPTGTKYIGVQFAKTSITLTDVENSKIMVARSTNTTYEPYIGNTYNIDLPEGMELCKIGTYQDYFYKDNGKWYLHKEIGKVVFTGNESFTLSQTANVFYLNNAYDNRLINNVNVPFCNIFVGTTPKTSAANMGDATNNTIAIDSGTNKRFYFKTNVYTTTSQLATGLTGKYVYWIYETPTNTEITYEPLIDQLNALSSQ